jgi:hypothetical protein
MGIFIPTGTYNNLKLWIKGSLSYGVQLEIKGPTGEVWRSPSMAQYPNWTEITIPFTATANPNFGPIPTLVSISFINTRSDLRSGGGEIYIDDIRYVK